MWVLCAETSSFIRENERRKPLGQVIHIQVWGARIDSSLPLTSVWAVRSRVPLLLQLIPNTTQAGVRRAIHGSTKEPDRIPLSSVEKGQEGRREGGRRPSGIGATTS